MKTAELAGYDLSLWVARALGMRMEHVNVGEGWMVTSREWLPHGGAIIKRDLDPHHAMAWAPWAKWEQGGPIIFREEIDIGSPGRRVHRTGGPNAGWGRSGVWGACTWTNGARGRRSFGWDEKSPLVAAMRCYVEHKLGEEVQA